MVPVGRDRVDSVSLARLDDWGVMSRDSVSTGCGIGFGLVFGVMAAIALVYLVMCGGVAALVGVGTAKDGSIETRDQARKQNQPKMPAIQKQLPAPELGDQRPKEPIAIMVPRVGVNDPEIQRTPSHPPAAVESKKLDPPSSVENSRKPQKSIAEWTAMIKRAEFAIDNQRWDVAAKLIRTVRENGPDEMRVECDRVNRLLPEVWRLKD